MGCGASTNARVTASRSLSGFDWLSAKTGRLSLSVFVFGGGWSPCFAFDWPPSRA